VKYIFNGLYLVLLAGAFPWLIYKAFRTGKYRRGLVKKFFGKAPCCNSDAPRAWFHGVSVGEVHLLVPLVSRFRQRNPAWECVISTSTDTGFDEAQKRFSDLQTFFWPLDFSWAVNNALVSVKPSVVVLAEGELWPNFLATAARRGVPVAVVNGRMSPRSFRRYVIIKHLFPWLFQSIDLFLMQTQQYAVYLRSLGIDAARILVTGSVKYDGAMADPANPRTAQVRRLLNVSADDLVWVAGSTQAPEEQIILEVFDRLRSDNPALRLILVPRQRERFAEVATLLQRLGKSFVRRSTLNEPLNDKEPIILLDTIGELSAAWGLATVAFVGGSLDGRRGGQNMIEPAAYGVPTMFGPHVWNFADAASRLTEAGAAIQVADSSSLETALRRLLAQPAVRAQMGQAAREFVRSQQGATDRTIALLEQLIKKSPLACRAA
jgi:3-deoxy-D-manno-octulosonic-acid transferase